MYLADKPEFDQYLKSAIYGDQPNAGVFLAHPLMYCARGEVLVLNDNFCVRIAELITGTNTSA